MKIFKLTAAAAIMGIMVFAVQSEAAVAEITLMKGEVSYQPVEEEIWKAAELGLQLEAGSAIKSGSESEVELSFYDGHQANLGANSSMQIKSMGNDTTLELFQGRLKSRVKDLASNENYNVNTTEGVASVRGTVFEVVKIGDNTDVKVEAGSVNVKELITGQEVNVGAGNFSRVSKNAPPTPPADLENYQEPTVIRDDQALDTGEEGVDAASNDEAVEEEQDATPVLSADALKEDLRREMRLVVSEINADIESARDLQQHQKESDVSTGRTLRDVHGNLVRVEQHVERPDSNTIGIINITKRDNYKYTGRFNAPATGARLDTIELKTTFNKTMPEKLSGWGSFLIDLAEQEGADFHPERIQIEIANKIGQDRESITMVSNWDPVNEEPGDPDITFVSSLNGTWVVDTNEPELGEGVMWDPSVNDSNKFEMWTLSGGMLLRESGTGETMYIRLGMENWLINNDGKILTSASIFGSNDSVNPFEIIRNIAFQNSLMVREYVHIDTIDSDGGYERDNLTNTDYDKIVSKFNSGATFFKHNMDNVLTPDFVVPVLESIVTDMVSGL